jgi:two-component system OmpR family response regulator
MGQTRILLADDDRQVQRLVGLTLDDASFSLCFADDGAEALRLAREVQPKLVLLDYQMPGSVASRSVARCGQTRRLPARPS